MLDQHRVADVRRRGVGRAQDTALGQGRCWNQRAKVAMPDTRYAPTAMHSLLLANLLSAYTPRHPDACPNIASSLPGPIISACL